MSSSGSACVRGNLWFNERKFRFVICIAAKMYLSYDKNPSSVQTYQIW
jgi:hypothetical protein